MHNLVKNLPVAKFYYQGHHSHPVRRTVLLIESNEKWLRGYELREGSISRKLTKSPPIKTYTRSKIARYDQCDTRLRNRLDQEMLKNSTLKRSTLLELLTNGV